MIKKIGSLLCALTGCILLGLALAGGGTPPAAAAPLAETILTAASDAYVADKQPATRFGGTSSLRVGYDTVQGYLRTLVRFELSDGLPAKAVVQEAYVELYVNSAAPTFDPPLSTDLYRLDGPWSEGLVTWGNQPALGDQISNIAVDRAPNFYRWPVTQLVREWATGQRANHGVMLIADASPLSVRARTFYAREIGGGLFPPRLVIKYVVDNTPPAAAVNPLPAYSPKQFTVSWSGTDSGGAGLSYYDVQYRLNGGGWVNWQQQTTAKSAVFTGQAGGYYEFRARAADTVGNVQPFGDPQAATYAGLATATMTRFNPALINSTTVPLTWSGDTHGGSPITLYYVYVSYDGGPFNLIPSLNGVSTTSGSYTATAGDGLYGFQVVAENADGARELPGSAAEASLVVDVQPPFVVIRSWLPVLLRN